MAKHKEPPPVPRPTQNVFDWPAAPVPGPGALPGADSPMASSHYATSDQTWTQAPAAHPSSAPARVPASAPTRTSGRTWIAVGIGVGLLVASAVIPFVLHQRSSNAGTAATQASTLTAAQLAAPPYCGVAVTPDMPTDTRAYVEAVIPLRTAQLAATSASGGQVATAGLDGLKAITTSDETFLRALGTITWSSPIRSARAQQLSAAVHAYDSTVSAQVLSQGTTPSDDSDLRSAAQQRAIAVQGMQATLLLPTSTCTLAVPS